MGHGSYQMASILTVAEKVRPVLTTVATEGERQTTDNE